MRERERYEHTRMSSMRQLKRERTRRDTREQEREMIIQRMRQSERDKATRDPEMKYLGLGQ